MMTCLNCNGTGISPVTKNYIPIGDGKFVEHDDACHVCNGIGKTDYKPKEKDEGYLSEAY